LRFKAIISRIIGYSTAPSFKLIFSLSDNEMKISATSAVGSAEETMSFNGDFCEMNLALNGSFLLDTLSNVSGGIISCGLTEPMSPIVFSCGDEKHVIMPIQLKEIEK
jgi:DNA polymerase III sliding clamp (beta) subunit (PCNA family)